ncbi:hypothetical protein J8273_3547 [Carpediemonas membranifera]|uniref:Uncharacterized protein n=1 Tax=Carpediemonas membranifera TaxID=201153 RepID=A0A8J6BXF1_9EUKA|nr:hypothetical protein J8273_3547 [Carpediemonas membranifera]|eukprot:KAG9393411.1 hypothetical protein J8273_3547 [Carpediemonas membranifera]
MSGCADDAWNEKHFNELDHRETIKKAGDIFFHVLRDHHLSLYQYSQHCADAALVIAVSDGRVDLGASLNETMRRVNALKCDAPRLLVITHAEADPTASDFCSFQMSENVTQVQGFCRARQFADFCVVSSATGVGIESAWQTIMALLDAETEETELVVKDTVKVIEWNRVIECARKYLSFVETIHETDDMEEISRIRKELIDIELASTSDSLYWTQRNRVYRLVCDSGSDNHSWIPGKFTEIESILSESGIDLDNLTDHDSLITALSALDSAVKTRLHTVLSVDVDFSSNEARMIAELCRETDQMVNSTEICLFYIEDAAKIHRHVQAIEGGIKASLVAYEQAFLELGHVTVDMMAHVSSIEDGLTCIDEFAGLLEKDPLRSSKTRLKVLASMQTEVTRYRVLEKRIKRRLLKATPAYASLGVK